MSIPSGITITRDDTTDSARVEIDLGPGGGQLRPLAYRVLRECGSDRYVIRDPFGGIIGGISTFDLALEIATGLAGYVSEWAPARFEC